jgi:23S rRNA pseudouridine1911/1915/1917 synthase
MGVRAGETIVINRPARKEPDVPRHFGILAEDDTYMAIDKPAGLPIHCTAKFYKNTLTWIMRERFPEQKLDVCHRLDRETSGVLLVARSGKSASTLKQAFASRNVSKEYLALVHGVPSPATGIIDRPMRLLDTPTHIMMGVADDGLDRASREGSPAAAR